MAWQEQGLWVAACIDLALAAQGDTKDSAKNKLHAQIVSYVDEALTVDKAHAEQLLSRKAPLRDRLRYAFWRALTQRPRIRKTLRQLVHRALDSSAYIEPLPLRVAA